MFGRYRRFTGSRVQWVIGSRVPTRLGVCSDNLNLARSRLTLTVLLAVVTAVLGSSPILYAAEGSFEEIEAITRATGVEGGLVVHLGCGEGRMTAALCANDRYVVQGLDRDAQKAEVARHEPLRKFSNSR